MKKILLLFILISTKSLFAQTDNDKIIIIKCKPSLIEVYKTHDLIFKEIEIYLLKNKKIEPYKSPKIREDKVDSINRLHHENLCEFYMQLSKNNTRFFKEIKSKEDAILISNFTQERFVKIDSLYRSFIERKKPENLTDNSEVKIENDSLPLFDVGPTVDSCKDSPLGLERCSYEVIYKAIMYNYHVPEIRDIPLSQFKIIVDFRVNKEGIVEAIKIRKTSGYFEFDMEAINVINRIGKNKKFNPGQLNGKPIIINYTIPINVISQAD